MLPKRDPFFRFLFELVIDLVDLCLRDVQGVVPQAEDFVVLDDYHFVLRPQPPLELGLEDDLVDEDLGHCPYLDLVVKGSSEDEFGGGPVTDRYDLVLVLDRLWVRPKTRHRLDCAHFEKPPLHDSHHERVETVHIPHDLPTEYRVYAVGPPLLKDDHPQETFPAHRNQPLLLALSHLLHTGDLFTVVAHPRVYEVRLVDGKEKNRTAVASHC